MRPNESQGTRILVVDDDAVVRRMLTETLGRAGYVVTAASSTAEALRVVADEEPALAIVDLVLPDGDGIELLGQLRASWPALPALVVTAYVEPRSIVEAMRRGAHDYLGKPLDPDVLLSACRAALARRPAMKAPGRPTELPIVGGSAETARLRETLNRLARTRAAGVLIVGDAGVGKTWLAGALHAGSHRHHAPCLLLDCGRAFMTAIALFGTGGNGGLLTATAGGTLILNEVERLERDVQAALLDWLEKNRGAAPLVVGLTTQANADGPLVAWLGRARVPVPPLCERTGDIVPLARHFLARAGVGLGRQFVGFTPEAEHRLLGHGWPGNVRELQETIARVADGISGGAVRGEQLALAASGPAPVWMPVGEPRPLKEIEDAYIDHVITLAGGNKTRAAQLLGIARETLRSRMIARNAESHVSEGRTV
jgi:DNA-binding NtrC family response regulator